MATAISTLADNVQSRVEEVSGSSGAWWSRQFECYTALVEAMNDLMLLIGRPTQIISTEFTLTPNTVWQTVPKGYFAITDIQGATGDLYKINLYDLDYLQTAWGANWTQDVASVAHEWAPIGLNMFAVHPACSTAQNVYLTAIQYPTTDTWPYTGNETVPFHEEFLVALEEYAASYLRVKELGNELQEGLRLFQSYLNFAKRLTQLEDRRDPLIFTTSFGAGQAVNPTTMR